MFETEYNDNSGLAKFTVWYEPANGLKTPACKITITNIRNNNNGYFSIDESMNQTPFQCGRHMTHEGETSYIAIILQ